MKISSTFNNMRMITKLSLGFGLVGILLISVAFLYHITLSKTLADYKYVMDVLEEKEDHADRIRNYISEARLLEKDFLLNKDPRDAEAAKLITEQARNEALELKQHEQSIDNSAGVQTAQKLIDAIVTYQEKFLFVVEEMSIRGLDCESGLEGKLKKEAHKLEATILKYNLPSMRTQYLTLRRHEKDYMLRAKPEYVELSSQTLSRMRDSADSLAMTNNKVKKHLLELHRVFDQYETSFLDLVDTDARIKEVTGKMLEAAQYIEALAVKTVQEADNLADKSVINTRADSNHNAKLAFLLSFGAILIGFISTAKISKSITTPLVLLQSAMDKLAAGDLEQEIKISGDNEVGQLAASFRAMTQELRDKTIENDQQNWLKTGQAELGEKLRNPKDVAELGRNIISYLAPYLNAQIGAIYLMDENSLLKLVGTYAYTIRKGIHNEIKLGEGLIGQAALEKQPILLTNVPDDYIKINSGLGETSPKYILAVPFLYDGKVKGVIEFGALDKFTDIQMELLNRVVEAVAIAFKAVQANRTKELLEQTRIQTEKLQIQQEELKTTNEELEEQTRALKESEAKLQAQQEELQAANEELEARSESLEKQKKVVEQANLELKQAQKLIEHKAQEVETASRYKSEFLANMSHELRTPLNSLLILSQNLAENKNHNLTEKQVNYARTINASGSDLLALINDILDLSKVEAGKMELIPENVRLTDFSTYAEQNLMPLIAKKGLKFEVTIAEGLPTHIYTDYQRVNQIIKNLIGNSIKFTHKGNISLDIFRPDQDDNLLNSGLDYRKTIGFSVKDTGVGIPADKIKLIFEAFQQADGSTSRKYGGTGLGLSFSRELAVLLGGEIQLKSETGKGSTFTLYLPENISEKQNVKPGPQPVRETGPRPETSKPIPDETTEKSARQPAERPADTPPAEQEFVPDDRKNLQPGDKSILIIEDDQSFAEILLDLAREKGFKGLVAADGERGLYFADYYKPSAIILDITLPGINGWTVMQRLKENSGTRDIPVHFMSAAAKNIEAMKMGAIGFLSKPVSLESVNAVFKKIEAIISAKIKKLLIIIENEKQKNAVTKLINGLDIETVITSDCQKAYEHLKKERVDSIILDPCRQDGSASELLEKIKTDDTLSGVPIILYPSKHLSRAEEERLQKQAKRIIIKKVKSPEMLLDEVVLFLHLVEKKLPEEQQKVIRIIHDKEAVLKDKTVLLVDDDIRNVFALSSILEEKEIKILVAKDGKDALACLDKNPHVDLVLMDIMMPEMDGYEATREIRKQARFKKLPVIALTAKAMKGDRAKCIEAGASDYIAKPIDKERLLSVLRVWLYSGEQGT